MKKFLLGLLMCIGVVALSIVSSLGYNYYEDQKYSGFLTEDTTNYVQVEKAVAQVLNPVFTTVDDVYQFYQHRADENSLDSTFMSIPNDVLINISQVVLGRQGSATIRDIVYEYRQKYKSVYQYIKPLDSTAINKPMDSVKTPPAIRADTVINGQKYVISN